jgi:hypothetical protein
LEIALLLVVAIAGMVGNNDADWGVAFGLGNQ